MSGLQQPEIDCFIQRQKGVVHIHHYTQNVIMIQNFELKHQSIRCHLNANDEDSSYEVDRWL